MSAHRNFFLKLGRFYSGLAILCFTTGLVLLCINLSAFFLREVRRDIHVAREASTLDELRELYPHLGVEDVSQLWEETYDRAWQYAPHVVFKERPRTSKFVNVSAEGFRYSADRTQSLDASGLHIYVFGGSTTFGYGVDDQSTIPACLQKRLEEQYPKREIRVFNFGRAFYDSNQEMVTFLGLIKNNRVPAVAVFIDGLNEGKRIWYTGELSEMFDAYNYDHLKLPLAYLQKTSTWHLLKKLRGSLQKAQSKEADGGFADPNTIHSRYLKNREIIRFIAEHSGVQTYFFIQPIPGYKNAFGDHAGWSAENRRLMHSKLKLLEGTADGKTSFNLAALLENDEKHPFVDDVHYSPAVCDRFAAAIAERIRLAD